MIGDWVMLKHPHRAPSSERVYAVGAACVLIQTEYSTQCYEPDKISPIPLTAEILEKNGFAYNNLPFRQCWEQFGLSLIYNGNCYCISCGANVSITCLGVHELQHVLRLCGLHELADNFKI